MDQRAFFTQTPVLPESEPTGFQIPAEVHTDDLRFCVAFDAAGAFESLDADRLTKWLQDLNAIDWSGNYSADDVAQAVQEMAHYEPVAELFGYIHGDPAPRQLNGDPVGFEVSLDQGAVLRWARDNAPETWATVSADENFAEAIEETFGQERSPS